MPQRDFGWTGYAMTRPLIEHILRRRVSQRANVVIRRNTRALSIAAEPNGGRVTAVRCATANGECSETLPAELVVDASRHGFLTTTLPRSIAGPPVEETAIGIDLGCTTAVVTMPDDAPSDWKVVFGSPECPAIQPSCGIAAGG
jgi:2-polyprenyl-6-methoxyphenol hydroxylase-like FAD-dependent oxidoreductase